MVFPQECVSGRSVEQLAEVAMPEEFVNTVQFTQQILEMNHTREQIMGVPVPKGIVNAVYSCVFHTTGIRAELHEMGNRGRARSSTFWQTVEESMVSPQGRLSQRTFE